VVAQLYDIALMSEPHSHPLDPRRRRLLFRATHRGTFENDLMLGGFLRAHMDALDDADLTALEALLELPDPDLADWLTGRAAIPPEQDTPMLRRIRAAVAR
jgi:antitoxin CptB